MEFDSSAARKRFAWLAWAVLALNIPVILWGAYVRVSYSGDGCGAHWPFCNGQVLPQQMTKPTIIEFTHRMMTSADTVAVAAMCVLAFLIYPKRHAVRRYAVWSFVFLLIEAALGAGLVMFRYVARDQSAGRASYLSLHLTNTLLLLGAITITAWLAQTNTDSLRWANASRAMAGAAVVTILVSVTGAIAALGDTLFPAVSMAAGMQQDFASASPLLLRLRMAHPAVAILGAAYVVWAALASKRKAGIRVVVLVFVQLMLGAANITLLAPVWMQLTHLLMADVVWIAVVVMVVETMKVREDAALQSSVLQARGGSEQSAFAAEQSCEK